MKTPSVKLCLRSGVTVLAGALVASCASVRPELLEWPELEERGTAFLDYGSWHNVRIYLEVDREAREWESSIPDVHGDEEIYGMPGGHELAFAQGAWHVGDYRYFAPQAVARRDRDRARRRKQSARLYVFQPRDGTFRFRFRQEPVIVESRRPWTPSVYYYREQGVDDQGPWLEETVEVGLARIRTSSRAPLWQVDGSTYDRDENDRLVLRGAVEFKGN